MREYCNCIPLNDVFSARLTGEWGAEPRNGESWVNVLRTTNFSNSGEIDYTDVAKRNIDSDKIYAKSLENGDIILEKSGGSDIQPVGRVVFYHNDSKEKYLFNNFTQLLRVNKEIAFNKYVFYFMFYQHYSGRTRLLQSKTTGIRNLKLNDYLKIKISLPSISEQKEKSFLLDTVRELIRLRKEQIEKLDLLIKSKFIDMFGDPLLNPKKWATKEIRDSFILKNGGTPSRAIPNYFKGNIPWITTVALGKDIIGREDAVAYITNEAVNDSSTRVIPNNSLLFGLRVGVGKVSINSVPIAINQDIVAIMGIDSKRINLIYLKKCIEFFTNEFERQTRGATIKGIPSDVLKSTQIPYPPFALQNEFADFVSKVEENKKVLKDSLSKLETTYKALMQQFFE